MENQIADKKGFFQDIGLIILLVGMLFGFMLGTRPLSAPDEGRYTEIPREMVVSGDYVTPRLNGVKYFEKPPLMYWLGAASIKLFGVNEWALRFWPAFLGLLTVIGTYITARLLRNRQAGIFSAGILATSLLFYAHTRILILDMLVSTFLSLGLFSFLLAQQPFSSRARFSFLMGFFACCAGAVMAKGLIGAVLPGGIILAWSCWRHDWPALRTAFHPLGLLLFAALTVPWHVLASLKNPEFFDFYFIHEHVTRYFQTVHNRYQPIWFFIPFIILGFFPWTPLILKAWSRGLKNIQSQTFFLSLWPLFIFLFFSFSSSKLIPYILPIFPPLAVLTGLHLAQEEKDTSPWPSRFLGGLGLLLIIALPLAAYRFGLTQSLFINSVLVALSVILGVIIYLSFTHLYERLVWPLCGLSTVFLMVLNLAWPHLDTRSVKVLAEEILAQSVPGKVVAYGRYYQDLPPYLNQTISVVEWRGELDFGMKQEDTSAWMLDRQAFYDLCHTGERLYVVTRRECLSEMIKTLGPLSILKETLHDVLVVIN